jgi:Fe-S cluster biogenesis protein NfuA
MKSILIKDTTREEREEIVRSALSVCGGACDGCSSCGNLGGGSIESLYDAYINGEKEISEINDEYRRGLVH